MDIVKGGISSVWLEHQICILGVKGSSPLSSTLIRKITIVVFWIETIIDKAGKRRYNLEIDYIERFRKKKIGFILDFEKDMK